MDEDDFNLSIVYTGLDDSPLIEYTLSRLLHSLVHHADPFSCQHCHFS